MPQCCAASSARTAGSGAEKRVLSAVNNISKLIVDGQKNLLRAAERQGVKRFLPSDFSVDFRKVAMGDNYNLDMRKKFLPVVQDSKVAHMPVINGAFYEVVAAPFLGFVDLEKKQVTIWGDGEQKMEFTATDDVAKYVAAAVLDPRMENRTLSVAGDVLSSNEVAGLFGFERREAGSVRDLKARIAAKQQGATNPWAYLGAQYLWAMVSGVAQADRIDNAMHPEIRPMGLKQFFGMA
ncbi:MAG: NmrA family protein [Acidobacteria bacterium]|nr:NmrA family protein [Acidobacteriota bacterium]